jgi:hypothetical protein
LLNKLQSVEDKDNELNEHMINVVNGGLPDEINWLNIKYNSPERCKRKCGIWILAMAIILITVGMLIPFKVTSGQLEDSKQISKKCIDIINVI